MKLVFLAGGLSRMRELGLTLSSPLSMTAKDMGWLNSDESLSEFFWWLFSGGGVRSKSGCVVAAALFCRTSYEKMFDEIGELELFANCAELFGGVKDEPGAG